MSRNNGKIRIELGAGHPGRYYDDIMESIIDQTMAPSLKAGNYSEGIEAGANDVIRTLVGEISASEYRRWVVLLGLGVLISTGLALYAKANGKTGLFWFLIIIAGALFIALLFLMDFLAPTGRSGDYSDGFGGGSSDGGASGDF